MPERHPIHALSNAPPCAPETQQDPSWQEGSAQERSRCIYETEEHVPQFLIFTERLLRIIAKNVWCRARAGNGSTLVIGRSVSSYVVLMQQSWRANPARHWHWHCWRSACPPASRRCRRGQRAVRRSGPCRNLKRWQTGSPSCR